MLLCAQVAWSLTLPDTVAIVQRLYCVYLQVMYLIWQPLFQDCMVFTYRLRPDIVATVSRLYCVYLQVVYLTWWPLFKDCIVLTYRLCTWHGGHCSGMVSVTYGLWAGMVSVTIWAESGDGKCYYIGWELERYVLLYWLGAGLVSVTIWDGSRHGKCYFVSSEQAW